MAISRNIAGIGGILLIAMSLLAMMELSTGDQRICGTNLRQTLEMVCPFGFQGYKTKRSSLDPNEELGSDSSEDDLNFGLSLDMLPFLTSMENTGLAKIRRRRHGIVHECCDKPCSLKEMQMYCRKA